MSIDKARFERVKRFVNDETVKLPVRADPGSAGYDFFCAETTIVPPYDELYNRLKENILTNKEYPITLEEMAHLTKALSAKIPLVSTGVKCYIPEGYYLKLAVRSSLPLKHWLVLGNSIGIIDASYYENESNDGEIYAQLVNLSPFPIVIQKGEKFIQGIITPFETCAEDITIAETRTGGFGSSDN